MAHQICTLLGEKIKEFLRLKEQSIRWLSRQVDVDYSTIYRLNSGDQKSLSFINAARILKFIEPNGYKSILGDYYPKEIRDVGDHGESQFGLMIEIVKALAADIQLYRVFAYATTVPGCNRDSIKEKFGSDGEAVLSRLINLGAIEDSNDGLLDKLEGNIFPDETGIKGVSSHHFSLVSLQTPGSFAHNIRASVNKKGLEEWYSAAEEFAEKLRKVSEREDLRGNIVVVASEIVGPIEGGI